MQLLCDIGYGDTHGSLLYPGPPLEGRPVSLPCDDSGAGLEPCWLSFVPREQVPPLSGGPPWALCVCDRQACGQIPGRRMEEKGLGFLTGLWAYLI